MLTVVTGWSPNGYREYGHRFAETFAKFWPSEVQCLAYTEEPFENTRIQSRSLWSINGVHEFLSRHKDNKEANGRQPNDRWKEKTRLAGYDYRFDAVKFCRQGFIPLAAAREVKKGYLCWLDADVVTFNAVPNGLIESLLSGDKALAYLGRGAKHSEIGFQLYNLAHPMAWRVLEGFSNEYRLDTVFKLKEWHSAYVFDFSREQVPSDETVDLTPGGRGHVWFQCPLGKYMDHCKGDRKKAGFSKERFK